MKYLNLIRKNGLLDFCIITILSTCSLYSNELIFGLLIIIFNYIYNRYISEKINRYISKEYILIIIKVLYNFHIINTSNNNIIILLFLLFIYLDKLLIKVELGSKLIISNYILKEIIYEGKYLSLNFSAGNAVELFIIESLLLFNTISLVGKYQKNIIDYIMIIVGLLPLYIILKNFFYL